MMLPHHPTDHALKRALEGTNGQTVSVFGSPPPSALYTCFWRDATRHSSRNFALKQIYAGFRTLANAEARSERWPCGNFLAVLIDYLD